MADPIKLVLYVAGETPKSLAAIRNLERICAEHFYGMDIDHPGKMCFHSYRHHGEFLFLGLARGLDDRAAAHRIDRDRLFHEDVAALGDCLGEMHRAEPGRSGEDYEVDVARDHLLVGIEAPEFLDRVLELELELRGLDLGLEEVADRDDLHALRRLEAVLRRPGAAPTAADQADADGLRTGTSAHHAGQRRRRGSGRSGGRCRCPWCTRHRSAWRVPRRWSR